MNDIARTPKQIGSSLRKRRRGLRLTQQDLASRTNLRQATISQLESGESGSQLRTLIDVMAALDRRQERFPDKADWIARNRAVLPPCSPAQRGTPPQPNG